MTSIQVLKFDKLTDEIEKFIDSCSYTHLWQSPIWFKLRRETKEHCVLYIVKEDNSIVLSAQVITLNFFSKFSFQYIPAGPLFNKKNYKHVALLIKKVISDNPNCPFLKIDPCVNDPKLVKNLKELGFKKEAVEIKPSSTRLIDLRQKGLEEIVKEMEYNTRYSIKKALKFDLRMVIAKNENEFESFYKLVYSTEKRQNFTQRDKSFFLTLLKMSKWSDPAVLLLIYKNSSLLSGGIFVKYQKRLHYLMGASDYNLKKFQGPTFLQFKAIEHAQKFNCDFYDFFSYNPEAEQKSSGPDRFKKSFGGQNVVWQEGMDFPKNKILYWIYKTYHNFL